MAKFADKLVCILPLALLAACAAQPTPIPPFLAGAFAHENITEVARIRYEDESARLISESEFAAQLKNNKGYSLTRDADGAIPSVTVRLRNLNRTPFTGLQRGQALPEFRLTRLDGRPVDNHSFDGKYTLVTFYSAASPASLKAVPALNALAGRRKDINLVAFTPDSAAEARAFADKHALAWPIVAGARKLTLDIGANAYPATALFDPAGKLVDLIVGAGRLDDAAALGAWLDRLTGAVAHSTAYAVPDFTTCPMPVYPSEELRARHTGKVTMKFLVSSDGQVRKTELTGSSGHPGLDQAAMTSLARCHFKPAMAEGLAMESWTPVQYVWSIQ